MVAALLALSTFLHLYVAHPSAWSRALCCWSLGCKIYRVENRRRHERLPALLRGQPDEKRQSADMAYLSARFAWIRTEKRACDRRRRSTWPAKSPSRRSADLKSDRAEEKATETPSFPRNPAARSAAKLSMFGLRAEDSLVSSLLGRYIQRHDSHVLMPPGARRCE